MKRQSVLVYITFFLLTALLFSACSKPPKYARYDVSDFVYYLETEPDVQYGQVMARQAEFQKLEIKQMNKLSKLISKEGNFLWLRINFTVPEELKNKDIGLYIGHLRSADLLFLNNSAIRKYFRRLPAIPES